MMKIAVSPALLAALLGAASAQAGKPPELAGHENGRNVWRANCELCHAEPASGAPQIGDSAAWAPRIAQGLPVLYQHARDGFIGPGGNEMPARAGNPSLSDAEIREAVDYMTAASK